MIPSGSKLNINNGDNFTFIFQPTVAWKKCKQKNQNEEFRYFFVATRDVKTKGVGI